MVPREASERSQGLLAAVAPLICLWILQGIYREDRPSSAWLRGQLAWVASQGSLWPERLLHPMEKPVRTWRTSSREMAGFSQGSLFGASRFLRSIIRRDRALHTRYTLIRRRLKRGTSHRQSFAVGAFRPL